jgi:hypothetical protein
MPLPSDLTTIIVTSSRADISGGAQSGVITFDPGQPVIDAADNVVFDGPVSRQVQNGVMVPVTLPCTGQSGLNPSAFTYHVTVSVGATTRAYDIALPSTLGSTVDLADLTTVSPAPAATAFASANTWTGTQTLDGSPPLIVPAGAAAGKVLTSDASGNLTLQTPAGGGAVSSVNTKTGAVVLSASDVGADPAGAATTALATAEAFATSAVAGETTRATTAEGTLASGVTASATAIATETSRATTAEALLAPKVSPALTGNPTAPTRTALDASTKIATTAYADSAVAAEAARAETAEALAVPQSQTFPLANGAYKTLQAWTVTGQADDPLAPFGIVAGSLTFAEPDTTHPVQGPGFWFGYNPGLLSAQLSSAAHGAIGISCFADAGDTNDGAGHHGLEWNVAFRSPDGTKGIALIEAVCPDNNTGAGTLAFRCGNATSADDGGTLTSAISFSNSDGSHQFASMDGVNGGTTFYEQVNVKPASGPAILFVTSASDSTFGEFSAAAGKTAGFQFQIAGAAKSTLSYDDSVGIFYILGPGGSIPLYASSTTCYSFAPWNFEAGATVTGAFAHAGSTLGFYSATPAAKPAVTGSRGGNAALASLMTALAALGLVTDSTT